MTNKLFYFIFLTILLLPLTPLSMSVSIANSNSEKTLPPWGQIKTLQLQLCRLALCPEVSSIIHQRVLQNPVKWIYFRHLFPLQHFGATPDLRDSKMPRRLRSSSLCQWPLNIHPVSSLNLCCDLMLLYNMFSNMSHPH